MLRKPAGYVLLTALLCAGVIVGAPQADRLGRLGLARMRVHLRVAWRAMALHILPQYDDAPLRRAIHLHTPLLPPPVTFVNGHIDSFQLDALRGSAVLLFFSTSDCSGICPHVLNQFKQIKTALGPHATRVRFVMIGVDAERNRLRSLLRLVRSYDPDFMALTADAQAVVPFAHKYGVTMQRTLGQTSSAFVPFMPYIIYLNPQGLWTMCFPLSMPADEIADEIIYSLAF